MSESSTDAPTGRASVQKGALAVAVAFLVIGVLGFVPGVTTGFGDLAFAGHGSGAELFGLFQVSVLHNLVHLLFGVAGLVLARTPLRARNFLLYGGLVYLVFFFYGIVIEYQTTANFVPFNDADNVLHLVLAIAMVTLSFVLDRGPGWTRTIRQGKAAV